MITSRDIVKFNTGGHLLLATVVLVIVYFLPIKYLVSVDWMREDFDYCFLIPLVIAYLIWEEKDRLQTMPSRPSWIGLVPVFLGIIFFLLGEFGGEYLSLYISFWFVVLGLCWTRLGWQKIKIILFPIAILLTTFPPPSFLYSRLTMGMQLISSRIGEKMLQVMGVSVYRSGNVIDLGVTQMQVVNACSGLRFLIPMLIVALLLVYFFKIRLWKRLLVLASAIPLAIVLNGFRIGILGYLASEVNPNLIEGVIHGTTGWIMFFVGTGIMFGMMITMQKLESPSQPRQIPTALPKPFQPTDTLAAISPVSAPFILALSFILTIYGFTQIRHHDTAKTPVTKNFAAFPDQLGQWAGQKQVLSQSIIEALDLTDYVQIIFRKPSIPEVNLYVAWYDSQAKGESIHSPETCLLGGGWQFQDKREAEIDIPGYAKSPLRVSQVVLRQGESQMLAYFWFPCRGRTLVNAYELKFYTFWDNLTRGRTDGALVRVITAIGPDENLSTAESRIKTFLNKALPVLDTFLPDN
ncbi:MAG: VPLPA-CTERM-specific exosortase XrtD [Thermodesulfobacteriota bacterium]|nr:VPLPA-CTERM-specific exosortase XrtD [Thermodesulfobacteriota bacterium]